MLAECAAGGYWPFALPPVTNFCTLPLGWRNLSQCRQERLINHLSWPTASSVNDGIIYNEERIKYNIFDCAMRNLRDSGPGSLMGKLDLNSNFNNVPIRPADWRYMGFSWGGSL